MLRKIISVFISLLLTAALSSCGYRISITKKGDETGTSENESQSSISSFEPSKENNVPETVPNGNGAEIIIDNTFQPVPMSDKDVVELYTRAMNDVKLRAPGYLKTEFQDVSDVKAGKGNTQIFNNIIQLVVKELLKSSGNNDNSVQILAHDDVAVRKTFPLFEKAEGCELTDMTIVSSAVCYSDANYYKIVITLYDQKNPDAKNSQFSKIMTPIDISNLRGGIEEYLVVLDMNQYEFTIDYTGCEIVCLIDKQTLRMTNLTQKMIMNIKIDLNMDLFFFQTKGINASGTVVNHLEYTDFDWN